MCSGNSVGPTSSGSIWKASCPSGLGWPVRWPVDFSLRPLVPSERCHQSRFCLARAGLPMPLPRATGAIETVINALLLTEYALAAFLQVSMFALVHGALLVADCGHSVHGLHGTAQRVERSGSEVRRTDREHLWNEQCSRRTGLPATCRSWQLCWRSIRIRSDACSARRRRSARRPKTRQRIPKNDRHMALFLHDIRRKTPMKLASRQFLALLLTSYLAMPALGEAGSADSRERLHGYPRGSKLDRCRRNCAKR